MAEIFISYSSEDRERVAPLVDRLSRAGHTVWWDRKLEGGTNFPKEIEDELGAARAVVVIWSENSIRSPWVIDEAELGRNAKKLIPLTFDDVLPPLGFRQIQTIDFSLWQGGAAEDAFESLSSVLRRMMEAKLADDVSPLAASASGPPKASIAVLPFVNMSADPEQEYFSDGISEELLNLLAKIPDTHVAARTSSFKFKGVDDDIRAIGQALSVAHVLEGSVRKAGLRLRITAQLIETKSGYHLWSETYDRDLTDIFEIQDEISAAIVDVLKAYLLDNTRAPQSTRSRDIEAYDLFLLGQQSLKKRTIADVERGKTLYQDALKVDPNFAPAKAGLAVCHLLLSDGFGCLGKVPLKQAESIALPLIDEALAEAPGASEVHIAKAYYHQLERNYTEAIRSAEKAIAINHNDTRGYALLAAAKAQSGDPNVSIIGLRRKILELDPLSVTGLQVMAYHYYIRHRFVEAENLIQRMEELAPDSPDVTARKIWLNIHMGKYAKALEIALTKKGHWKQVSVQRAIQPALIFLGEGRAVEHWGESYALYYYAQAGAHDEVRQLAPHVKEEEGEEGDYRISLNLALANTLAGNFEEASEILAPFDEPEEGHWGLHYHLTYGLLGGELALFLRHKLGDEKGRALYRERLFAVYRALAMDTEGTHLIAHRIGAHIAALEGDHDAALDLLEQQVQYSPYGALEIRAMPFFETLAGNPRFDAIRDEVTAHLGRERMKAIDLGLLPLSRRQIENWTA